MTYDSSETSLKEIQQSILFYHVLQCKHTWYLFKYLETMLLAWATRSGCLEDVIALGFVSNYWNVSKVVYRKGSWVKLPTFWHSNVDRYAMRIGFHKNRTARWRVLLHANYYQLTTDNTCQSGCSYGVCRDKHNLTQITYTYNVWDFFSANAPFLKKKFNIF